MIPVLDSYWKNLKSGTDIRGVAMENNFGEPVQLTDDAVRRMAGGFLCWVEKHLGAAAGAHIAVGRDSRLSGERIAGVLKDVFTAKGVTVHDCGLASTPSMFMAVLDIPCLAAVQITASHHPWHRNGLKFFTKNGGLDAPDVEEILAFAQENSAPADMPGGCVIASDHMKTYAAHLRELICRGVNADDYDHPLKGFKIAVDAGNGAGGFYAADVLAPLGAAVSGSRSLEPDGRFPNHVPNPEDAAAMESICAAVTESGSDLGVIFDTDVDRGGAVDSHGSEINRNRLVALAAAIALEDCPGGTIVTDSITSDGLKVFIEETLGGRHHRFKRGYKNVINEAVRLNEEGIDTPLAIETSGHAALRENYFLDDGAYLCTKIIIKAAALRREVKTIDSLLADLQEPAEATELRMKILEKDFRACGEKMIADLEAYAVSQGWHVVPNNFEGIRISFAEEGLKGWCLLRLSVHDPLLPLNIESDTPGGVEKIGKKLLAFLSACPCPGVDTSPLEIFRK